MYQIEKPYIRMSQLGGAFVGYANRHPQLQWNGLHNHLWTLAPEFNCYWKAVLYGILTIWKLGKEKGEGLNRYRIADHAYSFEMHPNTLHLSWNPTMENWYQRLFSAAIFSTELHIQMHTFTQNSALIERETERYGLRDPMRSVGDFLFT